MVIISKIQNSKFKTGIFFLLLLLFAHSIYSQSFENGYYRLTTQWLGEGKSLDVINDGTNNKLQLANTTNASGQSWKFTPLGNGYYRLTTQWLGETKSLDVISDGINYKLQLEPTDDVPGQYWKITSLGNGFYRITTKLLSMVKSLDIVNDGANNKLQLANTGNFTGQSWKITNSSPNTENTDGTPETIQNFKESFLSGFKIMVNPNLADKAETKEALEILSNRLEVISKLLKPAHLEQLKKVSFWIQYKKTNGGMVYHPSKEWLISNGYPAEMEKSIEISNVRHFIDWQGDQPFMVLHELAHAFDHIYLSQMQNQIILAYQNAISSGKYDNVSHINGAKQKHYALTNKSEYFAELTEAYFGKNDFYPFTKDQLKEFDPTGYKLMEEAWK